MVETLREERLYFSTLFQRASSNHDLAGGKLAKCDLTNLSPKLSCSWHSSHQTTDRRTGCALGSSSSSWSYDEWESLHTFSFPVCRLIDFKTPGLTPLKEFLELLSNRALLAWTSLPLNTSKVLMSCPCFTASPCSVSFRQVQ